MQARQLPASAGWLWIRDGWQIFRRQPIGLTALLLGYISSLMLVSLVMETLATALAQLLNVSPTVLVNISVSVAIVLMPGLFAGVMEGCRIAAPKAPLYPHLLVQPFVGNTSRARSLLVLGVVQVVTLLLIHAAVSTFNIDLSVATDKNGVFDAAKLPPETLSRMFIAGIMSFVAYLPVMMVLWFAPMLANWHGLHAGKAMFFSIVAVWRNRGAFLIFFAGLFSLWMGGMILLELLLAGFSANSPVSLLVIPLVLVLNTWTYCSFYTSYATVFESEPAAPA